MPDLIHPRLFKSKRQIKTVMMIAILGVMAIGYQMDPESSWDWIKDRHKLEAVAIVAWWMFFDGKRPSKKGLNSKRFQASLVTVTAILVQDVLHIQALDNTPIIELVMVKVATYIMTDTHRPIGENDEPPDPETSGGDR